VDVVDLPPLSDADWAQLADGEEQPWGPVGEELSWREKDRTIGIRGEDGRLVAVAGAVLADVAVADVGGFQVVGLGGLFVTRSARGAGLVAVLAAPLLEIAATMGPAHAMLFCRPELVEPYRRLSFTEIAAPVWVDQPNGRIEMPQRSMWRALRDGAQWPPGRVDVSGLPF
jgi:hypothetical protein